VADSLPTVWQADPHTLAKHKILKLYLDAWMPILSRQAKKVGAPVPVIRFVDGFAGPGVYAKGQKGSPILALEAALDHAIEFPIPVEFVFVENDEDRFKSLRAELARYETRVAASPNVRVRPPVHKDCQLAINNALDHCERKGIPFGPALVFLDQFGYSAVPMSLIARIMKHPQCEVLSYLFWRDLDRFISDASKHRGINTAFGSEEWTPAIDMPGPNRAIFLRDSYLQALKARGGAKYVWPFSMLDANGRLLYWLFFCTNNIRGLFEMKRAMWKVDNAGTFTFSDQEGFDQLRLLATFDQRWLSTEMARRLANRRLTVGDIHEFVLTETPCYLFKTALKTLEKSGQVKAIDPPPGRKPGEYPDDSLLMEFGPPLLM